MNEKEIIENMVDAIMACKNRVDEIKCAEAYVRLAILNSEITEIKKKLGQ